MKKRFIKALSLVLVLAMTLSLVPVSAIDGIDTESATSSAGTSDSTEGLGKGFGFGGRDLGGRDLTPRPFPEQPEPEEPAEPEEPVVEEPTEPEEPVVAYPAQTLTAEAEDGLIVTVEAPEESLPEGATVVARKVVAADYQSAAEQIKGGDVSVVLAADITFYDADGAEIEPFEPVKVTMTAPEIADVEAPEVIHIPDAGDAESVDSTAKANAVTFTADSFSVYAVVEEGDTGDNARATVNFISNGETIATMYVKNGDTLDEIKTIVYDPGTGALSSGQMFLGWTETPVAQQTSATVGMTIEEVRAALESRSITEGDTVNYYAIICTTVTLTYVDEKGIAIASANAKLYGNMTSAEITADQDYTPPDGAHNFEGWIVQTGKSNIVSAMYNGTDIKDTAGTEANPFPKGTVLTLSGDVTLGVSAPEGHWLIFNENGPGATYNAPQFVKGTEVTREEYLTMTRYGYTFGGWYTDEACTDGNEFTFGQALSETTEIFAKWTANETADYTVLIWLQSIEGGSKYDFKEAVKLNGTVGNTVDTVVATGTGNSRYARVNGTAKQYTGFHLNTFDSNVEIKPEGNAVVNVYYDRNQHTLTFRGGSVSYTATTGNNGTQYGLVDGEYIRIYYRNGAWRTSDSRNGPVYTGTRYTQTTSDKVITALYGQSIGDNFPIDDSGDRWEANTYYSYVLVYIDTMPDVDVTFTRNTSSASMKYLEFYVEALPGTTEQTYRFNNKDYVLLNTVNCKYNFFTKTEDFPDMVGFTANKNTDSYPAFGSSNEVYVGQYNNTLKLYYTRLAYPINYMDGVYVDGDNNPVEGAINRGQLNEVDSILYQSDLSTYNKDGANYYKPTYSQYTFAGWYIDSQCTQPYTFTTMPDGGITVYAKWVLNQYRVFLRPDVPSSDTSLNWGSESQQMNFRISSGAKVSTPTGLRSDYEMMGWYDKNGEYFDSKVYVFNDNSAILEDYNKTVDFTDDMDKYGQGATYNKDVSRDWITKKVELTARWRHILKGADGIGVVYSLTDTDLNVTGTVNVYDTTQYLDQATAVAQPACKAPAGYKFECWVLQKWDASAEKYVDVTTSADVYPGGDFTIEYNNAKADVIATDEQGNITSATYTIQLRAKFVKVDDPVPTHITWYSNLQDVAGLELTLNTFTHTGINNNDETGGWFITDDTNANGDPLSINEAIDIRAFDTYTYTGYTFLGWAKSPDATADDLFLKYEDGVFKAKDAEGNWVTVTKVAADENQPYDDLYAIWQGEFYVYHSGVAGGNLETVAITTKTYDLTQNLTSGTLYGGYYLEDGFTAAAKVDGKIPAYDGDNWTWTTAETTNGKAITPVTGTTYYIKEVPADKYLLPYTHYAYHKGDNVIKNIWMISDVDDLNYNQTGFVIVDANNQAQVCQSLTVTNQVGGASVKLTPQKVFKTAGVTSTNYLTYLEVNVTDYSKVLQYWVTPDGLMVTGTTQRAISGAANKGTIQKTDSTVASTITVFKAD